MDKEKLLKSVRLISVDTNYVRPGHRQPETKVTLAFHDHFGEPVLTYSAILDRDRALKTRS